MTTPQVLSSKELDLMLNAAGPDIKRRVLAHIAALEADNAALVKQMTEYAPYLAAHGYDLRDTAFVRPHPGTALLEEHRRALVRARNEGLERAKEAVRSALTTGLLTPGNVTIVLAEICALKEPEE
jgi:hypothetical protein